MLYLKYLIIKLGAVAGIVLFPGDTLPLRVLQPRFLAAVERARHSVEAPNMLGVVCLQTVSYVCPSTHLDM
jgi:cereblon